MENAIFAVMRQAKKRSCLSELGIPRSIEKHPFLKNIFGCRTTASRGPCIQKLTTIKEKNDQPQMRIQKPAYYRASKENKRRTKQSLFIVQITAASKDASTLIFVKHARTHKPYIIFIENGKPNTY